MPPPAPQLAAPPPGKEALTVAGEFIKYFTALGTGALVFSAGLVGDKVTLEVLAQRFLVGSWALLSLSVLGGTLAYARIPMQLAASQYDLEDGWLTYPARVQQVAFIFGMLALAGALFLALTAPSVAGTPFAVPSAIRAVEEARKHVPADISSLRLAKVQSIAGVDEKNPSARVWQVVFEAERRPSSPSRGKQPERLVLDVLLDARTGAVLTVP